MLPRRLRSDEGGAAASEYAMLVVFVATVRGVSVQTLGTDYIASLLASIASALSGIPLPTV
jgi:Flp pilus assembly pilin Flp